MKTGYRAADFWRAIDLIAKKHGLSRSGLAVRAGLDATTFNPCKRVRSDGRERWPGTEAIAGVLAATGETMAGFTVLMHRRKA